MPDTNRLENTPASMTAQIGGIINDAQQLVRQEIALARQEIHQEVNKAKEAALELELGVLTTLVGAILLSLMLVHLLYWLTQERFPLWACYGVVGAFFAIVGALLLYAARNKVNSIHVVPPQTAETMGENVQWIKNQM
jgi:hypothetical protein